MVKRYVRSILIKYVGLVLTYIILYLYLINIIRAQYTTFRMDNFLHDPQIQHKKKLVDYNLEV
jgi:hypothetical protein